MMRVINCEQGSAEWHLARLGIPTASMFDAIMKKGKGGKPSEARRTYMMKLASERILQEGPEAFSTQHTERGKEWEQEASDLYGFMTDTDPEVVGFITNGIAGCSPDRLVGESGGVEIKTKLPHLVCNLLDLDEFPDEHHAQVQGCMWVTGRQWWDLAVFWPRLPLFVKRAPRDELYISALESEVTRFCDELESVVERIRRYGLPAAQEAA